MFKGGIEEAAKMLQGLDPAQRKIVMSEMEKKNPQMLAQIKAMMVTFDDLRYLTPSMMRDLMQKISLDTFALALRGTSKDLIDHILTLVSANNKKDMQDILQGKPRAISEVQEAQRKIMEVVIPLCDQGILKLSPDTDEYV